MSTAITPTLPEGSNDRPEFLPVFALYQGQIDAVLAHLVIPDPYAVPSFLSDVEAFAAKHAADHFDEIADQVAAELAEQEPLRPSEPGYDPTEDWDQPDEGDDPEESIRRGLADAESGNVSEVLWVTEPDDVTEGGDPYNEEQEGDDIDKPSPRPREEQ